MFIAFFILLTIIVFLATITFAAAPIIKGSADEKRIRERHAAAERDIERQAAAARMARIDLEMETAKALLELSEASDDDFRVASRRYQERCAEARKVYLATIAR